MRRTIALIVVLFQASACAGGTAVEAAARLGIDPAGVVDVETAALAPVIGPDGTVSIVAIRERDGAWVTSPLTTSPGPRNTDSLHLFSYGGDTGQAWNTFVFGTAASGTARVQLSGFPDQRGGTVVGGAWVIALREKDLRPENLQWTFLAEDGTVRTGTGVFPPEARTSPGHRRTW